MSQNSSILVYFGSDTLSDEQFLDETSRRRALDEGLHLIRSQIFGLTVLNQLPDACAAILQGPQDSIGALKEFLHRSGVGTYESDADMPSFRAAIQNW